MKKLLLVIAFLCLLPVTASAQDSRRLNTGVLPTLWYSSASVYEGDKIKIYGGVQNHSGVEFSGTAVFMLDGQELSSSAFVSKPENLLELVSNEWLATKGEHKVELKIVNLSPAGNILAESTGEIELEVKRKLTLETIKDDATQVAEVVVAKTDSFSQSLASKILEYQKPVEQMEESNNEEVLGTSTEQVEKSFTDKPALVSVYNLVLGFLAGVVRHWKWTLGAVVVLMVLSKLLRRG